MPAHLVDLEHQQPPSGKTTKIKNHCSPSLFHSSFSPPLEQIPTLSSIPPFHPGFQNSCSPPSLICPHPKPMLIHPKPTSFIFPAFLPESPCSVHLVYPIYPTSSRSLPQISCVYSPLFSASISHPSCLLLPLLYVLCVCSYTILDIVYKNKKNSLEGQEAFEIPHWQN